MVNLRNCMVVFLASIFLTACLGGGGGGSSLTTGPAPVPVQIDTPLVESSGAIVEGSGNIYYKPEHSTSHWLAGTELYIGRGEFDGFLVREIGGGIEFLHHRNDRKHDARVTFSTTEDSEFREEGNYYAALKISGYDYDKAYFGGKPLGLEHSDFGVWKHSELMINGSQARTFDDPFFYGEESKISIQSVGTGITTFTGNTIGRAYDHESGKNIDIDIFGNADLTIDNVTRNAILDLSFDNFYTLVYQNIDMSATSTNGYNIEVLNQVIPFYDNNNMSGIDLGSQGSLVGNMDMFTFGNTPGEPTEAVGRFEGGTSSGDKGFIGSFGMRKE